MIYIHCWLICNNYKRSTLSSNEYQEINNVLHTHTHECQYTTFSWEESEHCTIVEHTSSAYNWNSYGTGCIFNSKIRIKELIFSKSSQSKIAETKFDELETELVENLSSIQPLAQLSMNSRYSYIEVSVLWLLVIKTIQRENLPLSLNLYFLWFCFLSLSDCLFWRFSFCLESNWGIWLSHCQMLLLYILRFIFFF